MCNLSIQTNIEGFELCEVVKSVSRIVQYFRTHFSTSYRQVMILHPRALIHIDHANFQFLDKIINGLLIFRKNGGTDAVLGRIYEFECLFFVLNFLKSDDWAEKLHTLSFHAVVSISYDSRFEKSSLSGFI